MSHYSEERSLKIDLFERWLRLMVQHRADERTRDCAITFMENRPEESGTSELEESCAVPLALVLTIQDGPGDSLDQNTVRVHEPDGGEPRGKEDRSDRYLQFAFMKSSFYIDLPNETLWPDEARRLIAQRSGFYQLSDRRSSSTSSEEWRRVVRKFNPVQKEYLNSDTRSAAEDMAYILFTLWRFPIDWQFYRRALVFNGRKTRSWEGEGPVD